MYFRVNELIASFSSTETGQDEVTEPDSVTTEEPFESSDTSKPKKKKKKKDKKRDTQPVEEVNSNQTDEAVTRSVNGNGMEVDSDPSSRPKEKKKKKEKKQESHGELPSPSAELPGSDSSGYISDKSSKKRKAQEAELLQEDSDILSAKKKKKKK